MNQRPIILMAKVGTASFIERDEHILAKHYTLHVFRFGTRSWQFLKSAFLFWLWILYYGFSADVFFTRFAHYHAFLLTLAGKLFGKKTAIVIGGSDAIWIPQYHYGVYDHWLSRQTTRWTLKMASLLLPVHQSLIKGVNSYSDDAPRMEGILEYNPDIPTPAKVIHNGYDASFWKPVDGVQREHQVLTVAIATDWKVFVTKGLNYYLDTATMLPHYRFVLVGVAVEDARRWYQKQIPSNVQFLPSQPTTQLREIVQQIESVRAFHIDRRNVKRFVRSNVV